MPPVGPIKRNDLIRTFKALDFEGPHAGGKHQFMIKGSLKVAITNPHRGEISKGLLVRILRQAAITREEWEKL